MELNDLKQVWGTVKTPVKRATDMQSMLSENKHPVLKRIRRQLAIEIAAWAVFLLCYYTAFDGDRKPAWVNAILIASVLMPVLYNTMGYRSSRYIVNGNDIRRSIENYLSKMKTYATISIASRILLMIGLLLFFTYGLQFTGKKLILIVIIALAFLIQLFALYKLWSKRLKKLENVLSTFEP